MVKVMGIAAGRKDGNSEILLKEALLACQELGAEVRMINLRDFKILHCDGCESCSLAMAKGRHTGCALQNDDDKDKIMQVLLQQDGAIFSVPTYDLMPASPYVTFAHRNLAYETAFLQMIGAIEKKDRVAGIISVGGSTRTWQSMALEGMSATLFTNSFQVVDMMLAERVPRPGQVLTRPHLIERAIKLGKNIVTAINTPSAERKWLGEEDFGWCPNCHSNALVKGQVQWDGTYWPIECQVCGAGGTLEKDEKGDWKFVIAEDGLKRDRTKDSGRAPHLTEIGETTKEFYQPENHQLYLDKIKKYKSLVLPGLEG